MINSLKINKINSKISLDIVRNFRPSSVHSSWKDKIEPIKVHEKDEPEGVEKYLNYFKSNKGVSAQVMGSISETNTKLSEQFTLEGLKKIYKTLKFRTLLLDQRYIDKRVEILGNDLAAAHFVVHRGGKVRFKGITEWVERDEDDEYDIPHNYDQRYLIEEIDISKLPILYDGLQNLENLIFLKTIYASECPLLDDWCMDRITGQFCDSIEVLDISHCPLITEKGLESIAKLRFLRKLKLFGYEKLANLKLICLLLEESNPNLNIEGVSYA